MKIVYSVQIIRKSNGETLAQEKRVRFDYAMLAAERLVYEYLGYDGARDTERAHKVMDWLKTWTKCDVKGEHEFGPYIVKLNQRMF